MYVSEREIEGERARVCVFVRMNVCTTVWSAQSEAVKTKTSCEKRKKEVYIGAVMSTTTPFPPTHTHIHAYSLHFLFRLS